jgi:hypothetical protein
MSFLHLHPHLHFLLISFFLTIAISLRQTKVIQKGEAQQTIQCILPVDREITCFFALLGRKLKYIE